MFTRYLVLLSAVFAITLAVVVGERLPAEALAVMVGVVAGVAASIPTSLIVVWFANRTATLQASLQVPPAAPAQPSAPEPRIVVVAPVRRAAQVAPVWPARRQSDPAWGRQAFQAPDGYAPSGYAPVDYTPEAYGPEPTALAPRHFTLREAGEPGPEQDEWTDGTVEEVVWER